ncbi:antibiotic biosynthesis monooxygenase [Flavobacterium sp. NRK F7]|uniref:antibiotic biosynthesis monooxygenase family protein n=1 Tax=Flavobacterium sp. NRK F7 TaxID=2954930 RepID=UPI00209193FC|nr:antibiotic biosynthesis monooxygenase [Flavobacterium sp. NRK F7]MCO6163223.1 antibiotic biosynthesis monooxygenase [Flavobacterium sp. NRK F7]
MYYAVIFTSIRTDNDNGYAEMAQKMETLARLQPGFISVESARNEIGITVSYWESLEAIRNWKTHIDHLVAQEKGRNTWYKNYKVRIAKIEREYDFGF